MIERLMACGFELNETGNVNGNLSHQPTALDVAASKSDLEIVDLLLCQVGQGPGFCSPIWQRSRGLYVTGPQA